MRLWNAGKKPRRFQILTFENNLHPSVVASPNRIKAKKASKATFWCPRCDRLLVGQYGKCCKCGWKGRKKKDG